MPFNYGTIIALAAAVFFYLRLIILQRQKVKQLPARQPSSQKAKKSGKGQVQKAQTIPQLQFTSYYLLGAGILLIIFGAVLSGSSLFPANNREFWWIPVTLGILCMTFSIK